MKKILISLFVAAFLATGLFVASPVKGSVAHPQSVKACSKSGWYFKKIGGIAYESYYNYATGHYAYIQFRSYVIGSQDNCYAYGETQVWTSDSFAMTSGAIKVRSGWYGQGWWGTSCSPGSGAVYTCYSSIGTGDPSEMWTDNWNNAYTTVVGPFGGTYGGSADYASAG